MFTNETELLIPWDTNMSVNSQLLGIEIGEIPDYDQIPKYVIVSCWNSDVLIPDSVKCMTYIYNRNFRKLKTIDLNNYSIISNSAYYHDGKPHHVSASPIVDIYDNYYFSIISKISPDMKSNRYINMCINSNLDILSYDITNREYNPFSKNNNNIASSIVGIIICTNKYHGIQYSNILLTNDYFERNGNNTYNYSYYNEYTRNRIMHITNRTSGIENYYPWLKKRSENSNYIVGDLNYNPQQFVDDNNNYYLYYTDNIGFHLVKYQFYSLYSITYYEPAINVNALICANNNLIYLYNKDDNYLTYYINGNYKTKIQISNSIAHIECLNSDLYILTLDRLLQLNYSDKLTNIMPNGFSAREIEKSGDQIIVSGKNEKGNEMKMSWNPKNGWKEKIEFNRKSYGNVDIDLSLLSVLNLMPPDHNWDLPIIMKKQYGDFYYPEIEIRVKGNSVRKFRFGTDERVKDWNFLNLVNDKIYVIMRLDRAGKDVSRLLIFNTKGDYEDEIEEEGFDWYFWVDNEGTIWKAKNDNGTLRVRKYQYMVVEEKPIALKKIVEYLSFKNYDGDKAAYSDSSIQKPDAETLKAMDLWEADLPQLLINEIYARKGYIFDSDRWNEIFQYVKWYRPETNAVELNDREKANVDFLCSRKIGN
jgi:hypothetical protein